MCFRNFQAQDRVQVNSVATQTSDGDKEKSAQYTLTSPMKPTRHLDTNSLRQKNCECCKMCTCIIPFLLIVGFFALCFLLSLEQSHPKEKKEDQLPEQPRIYRPFLTASAVLIPLGIVFAAYNRYIRNN